MRRVYHIPELAIDRLREQHPRIKLGSRSKEGLRRVIVDSPQEDARLVELLVSSGIQVKANYQSTPRVLGVGTLLSQEIKGFSDLPSDAACQKCKRMIHQMDLLGPEWCRQNEDFIASVMVQNLEDLPSQIIEQSSPLLKILGFVAGAKITEPLLARGAKFLIRRAITKHQRLAVEPIDQEKWVDPLLVTGIDKEEINLEKMLRRTPAAFLVGGGPSLTSHVISRLSQPGIWTMAINNAARHGDFRPSSFVCSDPPLKFHHGIWLDPTIMKFVPIPKLKKGRGVLRIKENGRFRKAPFSACDCPNVWGFLRRNWLELNETFFTETSASWGNLNEGVLRTGLKKTACTLLIGIRLLYYLGIRRIYLAGCDFSMTDSKGYAFNQARDREAVESNNRQYLIVNEWLTEMVRQGVFEQYGLEIFNTTMNSGLSAFPFISLDTALQNCLYQFPSQPYDMDGWYEKGVDEDGS